MSKRLLTLITVLLLLVVSSVAYGQELMDDEPVFFLTEEQINAEFTIPSTATRTISNLEVDVQEDGVHISFDLTAITDGTSNTLVVGAVLSELVPVRVSQLELENTLVSNYVAPRSLRRVVSTLVTRSWRNYVTRAYQTSEVVGFDNTPMDEVVFSAFAEDGIRIYGN